MYYMTGRKNQESTTGGRRVTVRIRQTMCKGKRSVCFMRQLLRRWEEEYRRYLRENETGESIQRGNNRIPARITKQTMGKGKRTLL